MSLLVVKIMFIGSLVLIGLVTSIVFIKLLKKETDIQEVDSGKLQPARALSADEEDKFRRFYRKKLKTEIPFSVYELKGPYDYRFSESRGVTEFSLKVSGIRIHTGSLYRMMNAGVPLVKDFKNYQEYIDTDLYFYQKKLVNDNALGEQALEDVFSKSAAVEEKYLSLIPKIEVFFPNGMAKPAFIVRYGEWNMDRA